MSALKNPSRFIIGVLVVGWLFDYLFWGRGGEGINVPVYLFVLLGGGLLLSNWEAKVIPQTSLFLALPVAYLTVMIAVRLEPFARAYSLLGALALLMLMGRSFLGGRWYRYGFVDYIWAMIETGLNALFQPIIISASRAGTGAEIGDHPEGETAAKKPARDWRRALPVLRGLLLATPVVLFFATLLAQADPIFNDQMQNIFKIFDLNRLGEYFWRLFIILVIAYFAAGVLLYALLKSQDEKVFNDPEKPLVRPFLGFIESAMILGGVEALFLFFVGIQFRYFFGGQGNITETGYTYAEYARRGFGEMVAVAFFALLLFLVLSAVARRGENQQQKIFSGMGIGLVTLVGVILVSAFQRLSLYEAAYGFTNLRMYSHIFMIVLGALLVVLVLLELTKKQGWFALACVAAALIFGIALTALNIEGLIARQNIARVHQGNPLDSTFLLSLTTDAAPALIEAAQDLHLDEDTRNQVGVVLACMREKTTTPEDWRSFHFSEWRALNLLERHPELHMGYPLDPSARSTQVLVDGEPFLCDVSSDWD